MAEVSRNIAAPPNTEEHPDSKQLRRFAADELAQYERATVLQHLADCAQCQTFLAVVTPDEGPPAPASRATKKAA